MEMNAQKVYASILAYMMSFLSLTTLVNGITNEVGLTTSLDSYVCIALLIGMFLVGFYFLLLRNAEVKADTLIVLAFFACAYLSSMILFPQNKGYLFTNLTDFFGNPIYSIFLLSLPGYLFARHLKEYSLFCGIMRRYAYAVVALSVIVFFFTEDSFVTQYLSFSYNMLLHLLFLIFYKPQRGIIWHNILVALGMFVFIVGGSRGSLVSGAFCCVVYMLVTKRYAIQNVIITLLASCVLFVFMIMKNEILSSLLSWTTKMNIDSRTIRMILTSEMLNTSGRDEIALKVLKSINIFGHGMMGDRVVCSGVYAHNLFLELMCDFGVMLGLILSVIIIAVVGIGVIKKIKHNQSWMILMLSTGFLKLMLSGSFLDIEPAFYILLGLCVNSIMENGTDDKAAEKNLCANKVSS